MNSKSLVEIEPLAKSFDSRLVMLQNSNAEKMEVLKEQILVENTHRIESFKSEVSSSLVSVSEKNESVEKHIQVFKDSKDMKHFWDTLYILPALVFLLLEDTKLCRAFMASKTASKAVVSIVALLAAIKLSNSLILLFIELTERNYCMTLR